MTLLLICWSWGSPGGGWIWTLVEEDDSEGLAADAEVAPSADQAADSGKKTWRMNHLRVRFCWLILAIVPLLKQELLNQIFEQHLIIWTLLVVDACELLEFLYVELILPDQMCSSPCLRTWTSLRLTMCMPMMTSLPGHRKWFFWGEERICSFCAGGWDWVSKNSFSEMNDGWFVRLVEYLLVWGSAIGCNEVAVDLIGCILNYPRNKWAVYLIWSEWMPRWSASPIRIALTWPYRVLWNLSTVPWRWWL